MTLTPDPPVPDSDPHPPTTEPESDPDYAKPDVVPTHDPDNQPTADPGAVPETEPLPGDEPPPATHLPSDPINPGHWCSSSLRVTPSRRGPVIDRRLANRGVGVRVS